MKNNRQSKIITTTYNIPAQIFGSIRIALISDVHDRCPDAALSILRQQKPDLILVAGDLMERHDPAVSPWTVEQMDEWQGIPRTRTWFFNIVRKFDGSAASGEQTKRWDKENGYRFLEETVKIAPVVLGVGNHEWYHTEEDLEFFKDQGVIFLDNRDCELTVKGQKLLIGGMSTRYDLEWLEQFSQKDGVKILICHHPDYYPKYIKNTNRNTFALIVAGHAHGGQWRLFSRGGRKRGIPVFAPGQGLFPRCAYGQYDNMIVSAGVSNTANIPRFGNPCEVVMIQLIQRADEDTEITRL